MLILQGADIIPPKTICFNPLKSPFWFLACPIKSANILIRVIKSIVARTHASALSDNHHNGKMLPPLFTFITCPPTAAAVVVVVVVVHTDQQEPILEKLCKVGLYHFVVIYKPVFK